MERSRGEQRRSTSRVEADEVYDDEEHGQEGGVAATLVVDDGSVPEKFTH